jgi:hypothetical protein
MSVTVVDAGERRALRPEELETLLRPHPPRIAAEARALFTGQEVTLRPGAVAASLKSALQQAARRVVPVALAEVEPAAARQVDPEVGLIAEITDLPVYQFVPPPAGLVSAEAVELGPAGATRTCSAFEEAPATILKRGNQALAALAALRYRIPDGDDREEKMDALAREITAVAAAARAFPMMAVRPVARYLELAPGELPSVLSQTVEAFVRSLRPQEALDVPLINQVGRALGHPKRVPQVVPTLDRVVPFYTGIDEKLWLLGQQMADVR